MTPDDTHEFLRSSYAEFIEIRRTIGPYAPFANYDWMVLPDEISGEWFAYSQMSQEFARELANSINEFHHLIRSIAAWERVLEGLLPAQKARLASEFINSVATVATNLPYIIRSRFIFASTHLSHQANRRLTGDRWNDDLELDKEIYFGAFDERVKRWSRFKPLKDNLDRLGSKSFYVKKLHDYRNSYNHRFSPRFVVGITQPVLRKRDKEDNVFYEIGGVEPLPLGYLADQLKDQLTIALSSWAEFQLLVLEQLESIFQQGLKSDI